MDATGGPNLNAYAERFVLSIKSECLDRMVMLGERHLQRAMANYVHHYHTEEPRDQSMEYWNRMRDART